MYRWWILLVVAIVLSIAAVELAARFGGRFISRKDGNSDARQGDTKPTNKPKPVAQRSKPHFYSKVVALCIGVEKYKHLAHAPCAEHDAQTIGQLLQATYQFSPEYLIGADATREAIFDRLRQLGKELGPTDALIVFFAGHGQVINLSPYGRTGFLLPYDADVDLTDHRDLKRWRSAGIEMQDLLDLMKDSEKLAAQHVLLIADTCCSGFMTRRGNFEERADLQTLLTSRSRTVLAATTERQAARATPHRQHGIFTAALLDVLKTNDAASVTDVFLEVRKRVARDSEATMTPQMSHVGDGDGEFVFLPSVIPEDDVKTVIEQAKRREPIQQNNALRGVVTRAQDRANLRTTMKDVIAAFETENYRYSIYAAERARMWEDKRLRFQQNAAAGDVLAMIALHYCDARGLGGDVNSASAYNWAKVAYESGHPGGKHALGRCFRYSIGVPQNEIAALKLIREASESRFPLSLLQKGYDFMSNKQYEEAEIAWKEAAESEINTARFYLSLYYSGMDPNGKPIPNKVANRKAARDVLLPAALADFAEAQSQLSGILLDIDENNRKEAGQWLERAAANGEAFSQALLARELAPSLWVIKQRETPLDLRLKPNEQAALRWAQLASDQDHPCGNILLACCCWKGSAGVRQNYDKAIEYCNKAAKNNYYAAFILQSKWHLEGQLLPKNVEKAVVLAQRAAGINQQEASEWLATLYSQGIVPDSMLKPDDVWRGERVRLHYAIHFFTLAARNGSQIAKEKLEHFAREIEGNPDLPYWQLFRRDFKDSERDFVRISKLKLSQK